MGAVPAYGLYGETTAGLFPDPLHVETIVTRSAIHAWQIRPHRHLDLHQLFLIAEGGGLAAIDGVEVELAPPALIVMPPMVVHGFAFRPGTVGWVASAPSATLARALDGSPRLLAGLGSPRRIGIGATVTREMAAAMDAALAEFARRRPGRMQALTAHAGLLAVAFARVVTESEDEPRPGTEAGAALVRRFLDQVEADFGVHATIEERAERLGVSAPHLSRVCRSLLGRSALAVVHDRIVLEARRSLVYTSMTVSQVAYALGFSDPAYFSRFFAARVGASPTEYRAGAFAAAPGSMVDP